ncbi:MAG: aldehyde dehydrogenase family protein, partial [Chloroflexaceae bacterium]|nr:aldehyde dehydrogenase family protein [Chloroflexaceae bacterium]
ELKKGAPDGEVQTALIREVQWDTFEHDRPAHRSRPRGRRQRALPTRRSGERAGRDHVPQHRRRRARGGGASLRRTPLRTRRRAAPRPRLLGAGGGGVHPVHRDADVAHAAARCVAGGFAYAGQSCISVQRICVHESVYEAFMDQFLIGVRALKVGHPLDEASDLSTVINDQAAQRVAAWLDEARGAGAEVVAGGTIEGRVVPPTVIVNAGPDLKVNCEEVFAPVVTVQTYHDADEAIAILNSSEFGLQAGIFTNDMALTWRAFERLEVGGVLVNDVPSWRVDHMPYGGIKLSGLGREGLKYAIEEMTEPRLLVLKV